MWKRRQMRKQQIKEYNQGIETRRKSITNAVITTTTSSNLIENIKQPAAKLNDTIDSSAFTGNFILKT